MPSIPVDERSRPSACQTCGSVLTLSGEQPLCPFCLLSIASGEEVEPEAGDAPSSFVPREFGGYTLLGELGRGGMGLVYRAYQHSLDRVVALKVLLMGPFADETARRRFQREAEAAAALQHPNIVSLYEVGEAEGYAYLTMELIEGGSLAEVGNGRPLPAAVAARYMRDVARAVQSAHDAGVIHRDLKPANILIGTDERPRVSDFGLARHVYDGEPSTLTGQMLGSPHFTSPEQASGDGAAIGPSTDIWGLGSVLYFLLTGRPPFNGESAAVTLRMVIENEPPSARLLNPSLPGDLETVCLRCLQKDPAKRYVRASEVAEELDRFLEGRPVRARPVSAAEHLWRWCRRQPTVAALTGSVALALVLTTVVSFLSARRVDRALAAEHAARLAQEEDVYALNIGLASVAMDALTTDLRDVRSRLEKTRPAPGGRDLRGFDWRYLWTRSRGDAEATLLGHSHVVDWTGFSPEGRFLATRSLDGTLVVWTVSTREKRQVITGVETVAGFSSDGQRLVFARTDGSVMRLNIDSGTSEQIHATNNWVIGLRPGTGQILSLGADFLPGVEDPETRRSHGGRIRPPPGTLATVSADGERVAVAGRPYPAILVFDPLDRRELQRVVDPRPVIALALSPDGRQLASAGFDGVIKIWQLGKPGPPQHLIAFPDSVWALAFSPDGSHLAAAGNNRTIKLWRLPDGEEVEQWRGHESTVKTLAFSPDGRRLASGSEDEGVLLWSNPSTALPQGQRRLLRGPAWIDRTPDLAFSPDSRLFAGTAADGTVKVWDTDHFNLVASFPVEARTVTFSPDGRSVRTADFHAMEQQWKLDGSASPTASSGGEARVGDWQTASLSVLDRVEVMADRRAATGECSLCAIPSARDLFNQGSPSECTTLATMPGGEEAVMGLISGEVEIWSVPGKRKRLTLKGHKLPVTAVAISNSGRYVASGSLDNTTRLWDAATGELLASFAMHNRPVWALAFSPDDQTLASGSCDKSIFLCSVPLRRYLAHLWLYQGMPQGYEQEVRLLRFSPDNTVLAAALGDGSVRFFRADPFSITDGTERP